MTTTAQRRTLAPSVLVAIIVTLLAWASAFIVIRWVAPHFSGGGLALGRLIVGTAVLAIIVLRVRWVRPTGREWLLILLFGTAWFGAYNVALNIAEQTLDAGTTAMIVGIGPILIALASGVFLGEGVPRWLTIGATVSFAGVVLIGFGTGASGFSITAGMLWAVVAAVTYAIGVICQKRVMRRIPAAQVTWLGCAIGMVCCFPFAADLIAEVQAAPPTSVLGMVYLGVVPTAIAFSTWAYALSKMPAAQLGVTTYVVPAIVVLISWAVLGEVPTVLAIVGGVLCLAGVAVSRRRTHPDAVPAAPAR